MIAKIGKLLRSERAETNYISTTILILVGVILLTFIISVFSLISAKIRLDQAADQMVKQIQLAGGENTDTAALYSFITNDIGGVKNVRYTINTTYHTPTPGGMIHAIQLGTPFYLTLQADATLGGFWRFIPVALIIKADSAGVSEYYWK